MYPVKMVDSIVSFWNILIGGGFLYAVYYLKFVVRRFWPTFYLFESRLQTVFRDLFVEKKDISYTRELLTLPDAEVVAMDWSIKFYVRPQGDDNDELSEEEKKRPLVIIIPGLVGVWGFMLGTSRDAYAKRMVDQCDSRGFRSVVLNYRGSAGMELVNNKPYCATDWDDLDYTVLWLHQRFPQAPIMAVGISLGGVILTNYIASKSANNRSLLVCAMSISIGWDFIASMQSLASPLNYHLFNKHLTEMMIRVAKRHKTKFAHLVDLDTVVKSKSIAEFDNNFTCHVFGFEDATDYYKKASVNNKVHDIKVPYLNLNSEDDPFAPSETIPTNEASKNSNVVIATTTRGGHIGFLDGLWRGQKEGFYERVFGQYATAMFSRGAELKEV